MWSLQEKEAPSSREVRLLSTHVCMIIEVKTQVTILPFRSHWIVRSRSIVKRSTFRRHCAISVPDFTEDIKSSVTLLCTSGAVDDLVEAYNSGVKFLINKHAPLQRKTITLMPNVPWCTEELRGGKHNLQCFKKAYYSDKIAECGNSKKISF